MAEHYRFFDSVEGDIREYLSKDFAEYFSRFLGDGIYQIDNKIGLQVMPSSGLGIEIGTGYAHIRGYFYHNDSTLAKQLDVADSVLDRIDRIVLRLDVINRSIQVVVKKGTFSSTPQPPEIKVSSTVKEMTLAQVRIRKGATSISAQDIIDERLSQNCGIVTLTVPVPQRGAAIIFGSTEPDGLWAGDIWLKEL